MPGAEWLYIIPEYSYSDKFVGQFSFKNSYLLNGGETVTSLIK